MSEAEASPHSRKHFDFNNLQFLQFSPVPLLGRDSRGEKLYPKRPPGQNCRNCRLLFLLGLFYSLAAVSAVLDDPRPNHLPQFPHGFSQPSSPSLAGLSHKAPLQSPFLGSVMVKPSPIVVS
jgi:hypothetical protein